MERGKKNERNVGEPRDGLRIKKYNQEKRKEKLWIHETDERERERKRKDEAKKDSPTGPARRSPPPLPVSLWILFM